MPLRFSLRPKYNLASTKTLVLELVKLPSVESPFSINLTLLKVLGNPTFNSRNAVVRFLNTYPSVEAFCHLRKC